MIQRNIDKRGFLLFFAATGLPRQTHEENFVFGNHIFNIYISFLLKKVI
ncbi:hypothetical protein SSUR61_0936 [Streptococcus suis R61]|uniref:Uncharacterized protein n=1 Tax=Streptococcus suis R61 TaxID=996306 RepID=A0AA87F9D9_STRSU|nr:hypothetical protein SSUR61_0936 [Streptococcus suis R61]